MNLDGGDAMERMKHVTTAEPMEVMGGTWDERWGVERGVRTARYLHPAQKFPLSPRIWALTLTPENLAVPSARIASSSSVALFLPSSTYIFI